VRTHPRVSPLVGSGLTLLAKCELDLGDLPACGRVIESMTGTSDRAHGSTALSHVLAARALLWVAFGDVEQALEASARAVELAEGSTLRTAPVEAYRALAAAHLFAGDAGAAGRAAEQALDISNQTDPGLVSGIACRIALSEVRTRLGDPESGLAFADQALEDCRVRGYRLQLPDAHLARAHALLERSGRSAAAEIEVDLAATRSRIEESERRILLPELELAVAAISRALGDERRALEAERAAVAGWEEMGSPGRARTLAASLGLAAE